MATARRSAAGRPCLTRLVRGRDAFDLAVGSPTAGSGSSGPRLTPVAGESSEHALRLTKLWAGNPLVFGEGG